MTVSPLGSIRETIDASPSKHPWGDPSDVCLLVQKKVMKLNDRLMALKVAKHTFVDTGNIPYARDK